MMTLRDVELALLGAAETRSGHDVAITGVSTDSRSAAAGNLFFCIEGENFDGHEFAVQAVKNGAAAVVASRLLPEVNGTPVILAKDTVQALGRLAAHRRAAFKGTVVAVTGSAGKTTVKELLAQAAAQERVVSKNAGNLNNQIGLPLSIFRADMQADLWILELGISLPHDMGQLGPVAAPDMAVIHNIGPAHLEGLGSLEGVARAKASLLDFLAPEGTALVNRDYDALWQEATTIRPDAVPFSTEDERAPFFCALLGTTPEGLGRFRLKTPVLDEIIDLPDCGAHHAENLAAVAAAAHHLNISPKGLLHGLRDHKTMKQRFVRRDYGAFTLIDDTYNANPKSMRSSMQAASDLAASAPAASDGETRPLVFILADMKELGGHAQDAHLELGRTARELGAAALLFKGEHAALVAEGFGPGMVEVKTPPDTVRAIKRLGLGDGVLLVKGSRSCRMEEHVQALAHALTQELQSKDQAR